MTSEATNAMINVLESLVDQSTIDDVVNALAEVCALKAEHLRSNWQDETTAGVWDDWAEHLFADPFKE